MVLPASYLEYTATFGPGELANWFRIAVPGVPHLGRHDLAFFDQESPSHYPVEFIAEIYGDSNATRIARMVFFADDGGNDLFAWDSAFPTGEGNEYQIFEIDRSSDPNAPPRPIAQTFLSFIEDYCLGDGFLRHHGSVWQSSKRRVFKPHGQK